MFGIQSEAFAKKFSYDESFSKMQLYAAQQKFDKALNMGLKIKKNDLTKEQDSEIRGVMERLVFIKNLDDALRGFYSSYDKYENYYIYQPDIIVYYPITPYIYANEKEVAYKLKFTTYYYSRKQVVPDKIILHSDGDNKTFIPSKTKDTLISYDLDKRRCEAWVNLSDKDVDQLAAMMRGSDVSIKFGSQNYVGVSTVYSQERALVKKSFTVYDILKTKKIKLGERRLSF